MTESPTPTTPETSAQPRQPRYEQPTDDLRQVLSKVAAPDPFMARTGPQAWGVAKVQRRFLRQVGSVQDARVSLPPDDRERWLNYPGVPLAWFEVESVWKDLPAVTEEQLRAESGQQISTT